MLISKIWIKSKQCGGYSNFTLVITVHFEIVTLVYYDEIVTLIQNICKCCIIGF